MYILLKSVVDMLSHMDEQTIKLVHKVGNRLQIHP